VSLLSFNFLSNVIDLQINFFVITHRIYSNALSLDGKT
jgi:hypothetical protein